MSREIDKRVLKIRDSNDNEKINVFIEEYKPFILNVVSGEKHAYIDIRNDDEFTIGLSAFNEAIEKYDLSRGSFLSYARLIIQSRLRNYWQKENKNSHVELDENVLESSYNEETAKIKMEILLFEQSLREFGLTMDDLVSTAPKHNQTLINLKAIGRRTASDKEIVGYIYQKKKLPVALIAELNNVSKKVIRRSKNQILAIIIIINEDYESILSFLF